jgi:aromatic ring-opening dioxygenase catalytic subunit (LigB family)
MPQYAYVQYRAFVQLSIKADYEPAEHMKVGELIASLRDEGVLIVGK